MSLPIHSLAFSLPGGAEWVIIAIIGLLLFGKRLPEVGKSLGQSIVEFKKGLQGVERDINNAVEADQKEMLPPPQAHSADTGSSVSQNNKVS
ncbi:MAG TPA: twin-arginine translocase TatA/TatE family subunit [Phycisphaerae bacterium]|nr:twin-arginine translocase TatA/TatE family subunit [Phycisphaerae bacterium]HOJ75310.1 twin-arginine translocase TatA/TatE family subunit [Phycisphaerae bacterium]HOM53025.1 twin-arginine translocase TatA/TatE family subunit [Phycisphaerae bacterium]HON67534.1 twin-arginine translocase TatA/TatE family subunit [Phycisphaerae bacterium]HOQ87206.1 twin-arginine translocase TatA/TatE family subunit [Phycisphaerae bacterium]